MKQLTRLVSAAAAVACVVGLRAPAAFADGGDVEIGGFVGLHIFSDDNELGVPPHQANADSLKNSLAVGIRLAYAFHPYLALEGELGYLPTGSRDHDESANAFLYRVHALVYFLPPEKRFRPFALLGGGGMTVLDSENNAINKDADALFHGGLGAKVRIGCTWGVRGDARILFPPSSEDNSFTYDFEFLLGAYKNFGSCEKKEPQPQDSDGDGIFDSDDQCPNEKEDFDQYRDEDGCPDLDNDQDGIPDVDDQCPNEAEDKNGVDDTDGCPEKDPDGDGLVGSADKCPTEAEDKDGFEDGDGCPDSDNDGDGFADADDKCPNKPETQNGFEDTDGCPDEIPETLAKFTGTIKGIRFKTGSATILRGSYKVLDEAAKVLNDYPDLRVEIQGHTDDVGKDEKNMKLSQDRAESVKAYLVKKGVDEGRLEAKGYGETQPIADNATKEGKAENRRVEFKLIH